MNMNTTIKIHGDEYKLNYSLKAIFYYEMDTERKFDVNTLMDSYLLFYYFLLASNPEFKYDYDEFIEYNNEDPTLILQFNDFLEANNKERETLVKDYYNKKKKAKKESQ